jgi:RelE toxin of RelE / RelB toxin-antitoxin system
MDVIGVFFIATRASLAYILGMPNVPVGVVETPQFVRQADDVWGEAERLEFVDYIARNLEAGDVIQDTGGVRKIRWRRQGMGKRGGVRVIYFYHNPVTPLFLLMVYAKAVREDVAPDAKKALAEFVARIKRAARG